MAWRACAKPFVFQCVVFYNQVTNLQYLQLTHIRLQFMASSVDKANADLPPGMSDEFHFGFKVRINQYLFFIDE